MSKRLGKKVKMLLTTAFVIGFLLKIRFPRNQPVSENLNNYRLVCLVQVFDYGQVPSLMLSLHKELVFTVMLHYV